MTQWFSTEVVRTDDSDPYFLVREREQEFKLGGETAGYSATTRRAAWDRARSQHLPVHVTMLNGETTDLGNVFNPRNFEKAAYSGYVQYGLSMTDGHYAPESFDRWVINFRKSVLADDASHANVWRENDAPEHVKNALMLYATQLQRATR